MDTSWLRHTAYLPAYSLQVKRLSELDSGSILLLEAEASYRGTDRFAENGRSLPIGSMRLMQIATPLRVRLQQPLRQGFFLVSGAGVIPTYEETGYAVASDAAITSQSLRVAARADWGIAASLPGKLETSVTAFLAAGLPVIGAKHYASGDSYPLDVYPLDFGLSADLSGSWQRFLWGIEISYQRLNEARVLEMGSAYNAGFRYKQAIQAGLTTGIRL